MAGTTNEGMHRGYGVGELKGALYTALAPSIGAVPAAVWAKLIVEGTVGLYKGGLFCNLLSWSWN